MMLKWLEKLSVVLFCVVAASAYALSPIENLDDASGLTSSQATVANTIDACVLAQGGLKDYSLACQMLQQSGVACSEPPQGAEGEATPGVAISEAGWSVPSRRFGAERETTPPSVGASKGTPRLLAGYHCDGLRTLWLPSNAGLLAYLEKHPTDNPRGPLQGELFEQLSRGFAQLHVGCFVSTDDSDSGHYVSSGKPYTSIFIDPQALDEGVSIELDITNGWLLVLTNEPLPFWSNPLPNPPTCALGYQNSHQCR